MFNQILNLIAYTLGVFCLGLYAASEFKYNDHISFKKWVPMLIIVIVYFVGTLLSSKGTTND